MASFGAIRGVKGEREQHVVKKSGGIDGGAITMELILVTCTCTETCIIAEFDDEGRKNSLATAACLATTKPGRKGVRGKWLPLRSANSLAAGNKRLSAPAVRMRSARCCC